MNVDEIINITKNDTESSRRFELFKRTTWKENAEVLSHRLCLLKLKVKLKT